MSPICHGERCQGFGFGTNSNFHLPHSKFLRGLELLFSNQPAGRVFREVAHVEIVLRVVRGVGRDPERLDLHAYRIGLARRLLGEALDVPPPAYLGARCA